MATRRLIRLLDISMRSIGVRIDNVNHHIYIADLGGAVYRFNVDGSDKRKIVDTDQVFTGIALAFSN